MSRAAVSRQIRELETFLGKPLFERLHRKVVLTEVDAALLQGSGNSRPVGSTGPDLSGCCSRRPRSMA
ncbi:MAG: LysR family transcriptional regulator [Mesorhizobium sp.]